MEPTTAVAEEPGRRLRREYIRLKDDIHENDERIEALRRQNADQLRALNALLVRRGALAQQVRLFAEQCADVYADRPESLAAVELLRHLCRTDSGVATNDVKPPDGAAASASVSVNPAATIVHSSVRQLELNHRPKEPSPKPPTSAAITAMPEGGDEAAAEIGYAAVASVPPLCHESPQLQHQLRPKGEFKEFLGWLEVETPRRTAHAKKSGAGPTAAADKYRSKSDDRRCKPPVATLPSGRCNNAVPPKRPNVAPPPPHKSAISRLLWALLLVAALFSLSFWYADSLDRYFRHAPSEPLFAPAPLSLMQQIRKLCRL